jgi:ABC-2 type transport system ATP-binding protein
MRIRVLGPVEAWAGATRLQLGPRKQRLILGVLATEANRQVSIDRLVDLAWPVSPPRTAAHAVRVHVSNLRGTFAKADVPSVDADLVTRGPGYVLVIDPERVDAHRFQRLLAEAAQATDDERKVDLLGEAVGLWSDEPLADAASDEARQRLYGTLMDARLAALEDRFDAMLRLGRHGGLAAELSSLVAAHPMRERLVG